MHDREINRNAPERYELDDGPASHIDMDRRRFLKTIGGGVAIACLSGGAAALATRNGSPIRPSTDQIAAWLHIAEDGSVTVFTGKVEVGQNIRTSLAQAVAEELRVPVQSIRMIMGDTDLTPYDRGTFGSLSTPQMAPQLRSAGAAAREVLVELAADTWNADRGSLEARDGKVVDASGSRALTYGELTRGRALVETIPSDASVTPADEWKISGTSVPKVGGRDFVTGRHQFVSDMTLPDMLVGKVVRPSSFGASVVSLDASDAEAMPGVVVVHDGDFVGVAAPDGPTAQRAADAVRVKWSSTSKPSDDEIFDYLKEHQSRVRGRGGRSSDVTGDVERGLESAHRTLAAIYTIDYIAHAPMEPRAALARWEDERLTVWTGTQRPFGVRRELEDAFGLPEEQVRVIMPDTGSAYGGKHTGEAGLEAARLARATGRPVKLVWTREEEFTWAYFRPAGVIEIRSGIDENGKVTTWAFDNYNSGGSGIATPYDVPNKRIRFHPSRSPLRQGSYRGLAGTANHFARESHMDELAHAASMDPLAFRLRNLENSRLRAVLEAAASAFGWGRNAPKPEHGFGIAAGIEKGGYVATCAEVVVESGQVRIVRIVEAFECGGVVNPEHLKNQIEGAIVQGIGGALFESIAFGSDGTITNPRFSNYRVPRFSDTPEMEVVLVDRKDLPSAGAGETPIMSVAPAVGNAIFDATGIRLHSLPMAPDGIET